MAPLVSLKTELLINGVWTDVSAQTYQRDGYTITRGRRSEGSTADASTCTQTYNNRSGNFSPRNPLGAYYGFIGRNTRVRVSLPASSSYLLTTSAIGDCVTAPDNARLDITGDIDLRVDVWLSSWRSVADLIGKYDATSNQRSYELVLGVDGYLQFVWSPDGTNRTVVASTLPVPAPITGRKAVRVAFQVNNGAAGNTATFYTSDTISGTWTQLGSPVVTAGTTSIFNSTALLYIGDIAGANGGNASSLQTCRFYAARVLNGIGGTAAANPDFTAQTDGATSFTDAAGNTFTVQGSATIVGRNYRFYGEVSEWPPLRDQSDTDRYIQVTANGPLRRLGRGSKPLKSAYYRGCTSPVAPLTNLQAYWPCEDSVGATSISSGFSTDPSMTISGTPVLATDSTSFVCSAPLPTLGTASFTGNVPGYASTGNIQVTCLLAIPGAGIANNAVILRLACGGTATRWDLVYTTASGGSITINAYDSGGVNLLSSTASFSLNGTPTSLVFYLSQSGSNVVWNVSTYAVGASSGPANTGTLSSRSVTSATQVVIAPNKDCANMTLGHITVQSIAGLVNQLNQLDANAGETATARIARLCAEEGITVTVMGTSPNDDVTMGNQTQKTLLDLLRECETADAGILYESRDFFGLAYRSSGSMQSNPATLTLDYSNADLSDFKPTEDDRYTVNDLTVQRNGGSSARYTVTSGTLSTQDPPNGVGVYDASVTLATNLDQDLPNQASWRAHLGTVDEPRHPALPVNLLRPQFTANSAKTLAAQTVDVGDRIVIQNPPSDQPPNDISQIVIGYTENLNAYQDVISFTGQPESPFHVPIYGDGTSRWSSSGSDLGVGLATSQVAFSGTQSRSLAGSNVASILDVRVFVALSNYASGGEQVIAGKYINTGNQRAFAFGMSSVGRPILYVSSDGATFTLITATATPTLTNGTAYWLRAVFTPNDGGVYSCSFYTSPDGEVWTLVGAKVTGGATLSLFASNGLYQIGARSGTSNTSGMTGTIYYVQVLDGVGGTSLVTGDPKAWTDGYSGAGTGSTLTSQTTSQMTVDTPAEMPWSHADGNFDVIVSGERMTVTAVTGTATPQVFTVTRAVNGILKAHSANETVALFDPRYWSF